MNTTILCPLTEAQLDALMEWHHAEAAHAATMPERHDHLRDAADLRHRLIDAQNRTEDHT